MTVGAATMVEEAKTAAAYPSTFLVDPEEIPTMSEPIRRLEAGGGRSHHTPSRLRPLARRRASTCCPRRVRIRTRKPWVFFRLRLFGWKVRFICHSLQFTVDRYGPGQRATVITVNKSASFIPRNFMLPLTRSTVKIAIKGFPSSHNKKIDLSLFVHDVRQR